jgi:hypothetical protein
MKKKELVIFLIIFCIAILFALFTNHRWEDWYITFRASKNLAIGNGLVFNVGERVHSFTSALGTIIPALFFYIVNNDEFVIWSFRVLNAALLGITGIIIFRIFEYMKFNKISSYLLIFLFATNFLIIDFSINGMETAFMMLFLSLYLYLFLIPTEKYILNLALIMAGLMYTRPDGIVYFGALSFGFFCFSYKYNPNITSRMEFIKCHFLSGTLAFLIYLPWIIITWIYYGSPIPHTIVAKGALMDYSVLTVLFSLIKFPFTAIFESNTLNLLFLTPYAGQGQWLLLHAVSKPLSIIATFYFVIPGGKKEIKAISLGVLFMHFYLNHISGQGGMPWYLPNIALPTIMILSMIVGALKFEDLKGFKRILVAAVVSGIVIHQMAIFILGANMIKINQEKIDFGNRKQIGLWLKKNSKEGETVFLECLGYIGYYSGLKTYDFPGMSSPEVVASRKSNHSNKYAVIINDLKPDWLVLRPEEVTKINNELPVLQEYKLVKEFNVKDQLPRKLFLFGSGCFDTDSYFIVYKRI